MQRLADRVSGVFVPVVIALARRDARRSGSAPGERADVRLHRRRRGADHRLPVRARARDADRAAGRHRPRRPARPPDQGPGGPRVHAPGRHDRARQDRHRDDRPDGARRRGVAAEGATRDDVLRLAGALEDASEHPIARAIAAAARGDGPLPPVDGLRQPRGPRRRGRRRGPRVQVGRPALCRLAPTSRRARRRAARRRGARPHRGRGRLGRRGRARCSSSPTRSSRRRPRRSRGCRRSGCGRCC